MSKIESKQSRNFKVIKREKISFVRVKPENVRELSQILFNEFSANLSPNPSIEFRLQTDDETQLEDNTLSLFEPGGALETRRLRSIEMEYTDYQSNRRIYITLRHNTQPWLQSEIYVRGNDETWTFGIMQKIRNSISSWEKQKQWPNDYNFPLSMVIALLLIFGLTLIGYTILTYLKLDNKAKLPATLLIFFLSFFATWLDVPRRARKIQSLFPSIEFLLGPDYLQLERNKRKKLVYIIVFGLLPLALGIIFQLLIAIFNKL